MKKKLLPIFAMYALLMVGGFSVLTSCLDNVEIVIKTGTISIVNDNEKGSVSADKSSGNVGDIIHLTIVAKKDFEIDTVKVNDTLLVGPNYSFKLIEGENKVIVTFKAKEVMEPVISKILSVKTLPTKVQYIEGERLDLTGLQINEIIENDGIKGEPVAILDYVTDPLDNSELKIVGDIIVNVTKIGYTATSFKINVKKHVPVIEKILQISKLPNKVEYEKGEKLDLTGLLVNEIIKTDGVSGPPIVISDFETDIKEQSILNTLGEITINVTKEGYTATSFKIKVKEHVAEISKFLSVQNLPTKVVYEEGEMLDLTGLVISEIISTDGVNGTPVVINDYVTNPADKTILSKTGEVTIIVTKKGVNSTSFTINVSPKITKYLEISGFPSKEYYYVGEALDLTGMVVEQYVTQDMNVISHEEIFDYTTDPVNGTILNTIGTTIVTVSKDGYEPTSFTISVEDKTSTGVIEKKLSVALAPNKIQYYVGEILDLAGLEVKEITLLDGVEQDYKTITDYICNPTDGSILNEAGRIMVEVTKTGFISTSFAIMVAPAVSESEVTNELIIMNLPYKLEYRNGEVLDLTGLVVHQAIFTDGVLGPHNKIDDYTTSLQNGTIIRGEVGTFIAINITKTDYLSISFNIMIVGNTEIVKKLMIAHLPDKLAYYKGDLFDTTGLSVHEITYKNDVPESSLKITDYVTSIANGEVIDIVGNGIKVMITKKGCESASFEIDVSIDDSREPVDLRVVPKIWPNKIVYQLGERLDLTGLVVCDMKTQGIDTILEETVITDYTTDPVDGTILNTPGDILIKIHKPDRIDGEFYVYVEDGSQ